MEKFIAKIVVFATMLLLCVVGFATSCSSVPSGSVGVVKHFGAVQPNVKSEGLNFIRPWPFASMDVLSIRMNAVSAEAAASSKDLQAVHTTVNVQYSITGAMAPKVVQSFGYQENLEANVLAPAFQEAVKAVTSRYNAEQLITKRSEVKQFIEAEITKYVEKVLAEKDCKGAIHLANVAITNFEFSKEFNQSIEAKVKAEQDALRAENEKKTKVTQAEAAATQKKLEADANAYQIENESRARADAIKRESEALQSNPNLVDLRIAEKWNGQLPTYTNGMPLMKLAP